MKEPGKKWWHTRVVVAYQRSGGIPVAGEHRTARKSAYRKDKAYSRTTVVFRTHKSRE